MTFTREDISLHLAHLLTDKARRPELLDGFELDDASLASHRGTCARLHGEKSHEAREAIAIYGALFDRGAPHYAAREAARDTQVAEADAQLGALAGHLEKVALRIDRAAEEAHERSIEDRERDLRRQAAALEAEKQRAQEELKRADERENRAQLARWVQIGIQLAIVALLAALFASRAPAQTTVVQGIGAAGTPAGRVLTVQGVSGGTALPVSAATTAATADASSTSFLTSAASTNATSVKASAGNVYTIRAINTTATLYYLRMYNLASAPTCSSATGFVETIPIPASATGAGLAITQYPQAYTTGIAFCLTGGGSSTDNTNAATGVYVTVLYK